MNRTTIFGALLVATVVATGMLAATAVGGSTTSAAAPSGTVTLSGWASSPAETKLLRQTIASFGTPPEFWTAWHQAPDVRVCRKVDAARFLRLYESTLGR